VTSRRSNILVWFGVAGGAAAWTVQFVTNLAFTFAQCNQPTTRWQLPVHGWQIGLSAAAVAVVLASMGTCVWIFLRTFRVDDVFGQERRGDGSAPPLGRVHFLSILGFVINLLVLAIVVMTGIGAPLLPVCQQS
jgi:putative flippase GtrA